MFFLSREMNLFFSKSPKINCFFWGESAIIQCARWAEKNTCFFANARPKSYARAHLKQRKNIVALEKEILSTQLETQKRLSIDVRVDPYSAGMDFSRQNLTSVDVRF